jgi:hypothetical protein
VHKTSGCDAMTCGQDAHGGNAQRGCGKHFTWGSNLGSGWPAAKPYTADLRQHGAKDDEGDGAGGAVRNERRLQLDAKEEHLLCAGAPLLCDGCGDALVGPRLSCMQCPGTVDLCIGCVGKVVRSKLTLRDGSMHPKGHVFRRVRAVPLAGTPAAARRGLDLTGDAATSLDLTAGGGGGFDLGGGAYDLTGDGGDALPAFARGGNDRGTALDLTGGGGGGSTGAGSSTDGCIDLTGGGAWPPDAARAGSSSRKRPVASIDLLDESPWTMRTQPRAADGGHAAGGRDSDSDDENWQGFEEGFFVDEPDQLLPMMPGQHAQHGALRPTLGLPGAQDGASAAGPSRDAEPETIVID